jgi:dipeptidyl-peptidase-4
MLNVPVTAAVKDGELTVERIYGTAEFKAKEPAKVRWIEDGTVYTLLEDSATYANREDIVRYEPASGDRRVLVSAQQLTPSAADLPLKIDDYAWAPDGRRLLIFTNAQRVWRQKTRGDYWILDLETDSLRKLGGEAEEAATMFAKFSPDSTRVAYVHSRNIYVQDLMNFQIRQLTSDGSDLIINGTSDWVYEEEFGLRDGFRWSPDGRFIAFWQFDTEGVPIFHLINNTEELYPKLTPIRYPKVGQTNSACRVGVVSTSGGEPIWLELPGDSRNHYIPRMDWVPKRNEVVLQRLNRLQNRNDVILTSITTTPEGKPHLTNTRTLFSERDDAWLDVADRVEWAEDGSVFAWLSERDGWQHIYLVDKSGRLKLVTPGEFDVIEVMRVDAPGGWVYFTASPSNPTQQYLYRTSLDGSGKLEQLSPKSQEGTHSYRFSGDGAWAIHTYSSFGRPPTVDLVSLPDHESVRVLEANDTLRKQLSVLEQCPSSFFRIEIEEDVLLDGWVIKPPDFDPDRSYPLLFYVYGETGSQTVEDRWGGDRYLWHLMLAQRGYIVTSIDNRGTPAPRGRAWRKSVYRQIGILASADQAAAARAIVETWPYVDPDKIGIWGWSGGGSMSLNMIFRYPELYGTAMAVAPVPDQRLYDTIYQERYMGLPDDNSDGYIQGSPITFAKQLRGNLLIVHGTGDDNVHYQGSEKLVNELIKHNRQFTMMSYPNRSHSIREGKNTLRHLFELLTRYLAEKLPPEKPE